LSLLIHALLIGGIGFVAAKAVKAPPMLPMVEVLLLSAAGSHQNANAIERAQVESKSASHEQVEQPLIMRYHNEIDSLQASLDRLNREVFVSASKMPDDYSVWMNRWRRKVEAVGNQYAQQQDLTHLHGEVLLAVSVQTNGHVHSVKVLNSSGKAPLDQAAQHIARLAGPFEPLPEAIREDVDVLHIMRTWRFTATGTRVTF
jgi:protein TonB